MTLVCLRANGSALVLDVAGPKLPRVLHWGADLGSLTGFELATRPFPMQVDEPMPITLLPAQADGWQGRPGLAGHRDGAWPFQRLTLTGEPLVELDPAGGGRIVIASADEDAGIAVASELMLSPRGVLRMRHTVTNAGAGVWTLDRLEALLPLPGQAQELLDFSGRWPREKQPQRSEFQHGSHVRENRRGHTGHDATGLLIAGTPGFGFRSGEVWGVHIGWSGDHVHVAERFSEGVRLLGGGELLFPGEVRLAPGEAYASPWAYFAYSAAGLDGLSSALHRELRARPHHPHSPRPMVLNIWEAVYFDHRLDRLKELADVAARIGVERFVVDDGWFLGRRDDTAGLGDWYVDPEVWPDGLHPLVDHVRGLGLQVGLWFEPEMVNPRSRLAEEHPDWVLATPGRWPVPARNQVVLDVAHPDAYAYLLDRISSLVTEYGIDYIKWDHNRDLVEAVHSGQAGVRAQTLAVYRLLAEVRRRHPKLEIESCSGGGARIDYGILEHTDRVWTSDTNDALERQAIQRWTGLLLPPELMGAHVGPPHAHTTGRYADLPFRAATALFGHAGLEWDLTSLSEPELAQLTAWITLYKRLRSLLHGGDVVHADHPDPAGWLHGVVAADQAHAVYCYAQLTSPLDFAPPALRLPGLDPAQSYEVRVLPEVSAPVGWPSRSPAWRDGITASGAVLSTVGLRAPRLNPAESLVLELRALPTAPDLSARS
ncbi:MAG: alpha-galactosidase [Hamadaea sp.]|uniref:alpha-galactosidase n=1 Tax=Hamadaea sp. TaxID=2024425 RepID=UPI0017960F60|nr:alpha-galactosidase [Hamadaea sp.]NUR74078.1 alpha-galactosidase [Hamadaea sp.]NUT23970.1 alpha-galactosidase [Hamadaea sp.]